MTSDTVPLIDAIDRLNAGDVIGLPTETVYGLAANATDSKAVQKIYDLKKRPSFNPLIIHVLNQNHAEKIVTVSPVAAHLMDAFWPGPLTLILGKIENCPIADLASAGLSTLAVRTPNHPVALEILKKTGLFVAAPSANISETVSPTTAAHVTTAFPGLCVIDGGPCTRGVESTILDLTADIPKILRPGTITQQDIELALGTKIHGYETPQPQESAPQKAPGQQKRHYAPSIPVRLNVSDLQAGEALLSFGGTPLPDAPKAVMEINLSASGDLAEAAVNLFAHLRLLDAHKTEKGIKAIAVMPLPNKGIGVALNDRLKRAAHKSE